MKRHTGLTDRTTCQLHTSGSPPPPPHREILRYTPGHLSILPHASVVADCCDEANRLLLHFVLSLLHLPHAAGIQINRLGLTAFVCRSSLWRSEPSCHRPPAAGCDWSLSLLSLREAASSRSNVTGSWAAALSVYTAIIYSAVFLLLPHS